MKSLIFAAELIPFYVFAMMGHTYAPDRWSVVLPWMAGYALAALIRNIVVQLLGKRATGQPRSTATHSTP